MSAAGQRIVVDPVTRIEGHLRIEAEVKDGKIVDAWSAGIDGARPRNHPERPRSARRSGVLRTRVRRLHHADALASVRAVEDAVGIDILPVAGVIRT